MYFQHTNRCVSIEFRSNEQTRKGSSTDPLSNASTLSHPSKGDKIRKATLGQFLRGISLRKNFVHKRNFALPGRSLSASAAHSSYHSIRISAYNCAKVISPALH